MKNILTKAVVIVLFAQTLFYSGSVFASSVTVGNNISMRISNDSYSNFTVVDTNSPVNATGTLFVFNYYASSLNSFQFILVDASSTVRWVGASTTPVSVGINSWFAPVPVPVSTGWNLGVHFNATGTIPFDSVGLPAMYTANNTGLPVVGSVFTYQGTTNRTYSFNAAGSTTPVVVVDPVATSTISGIVYNDINKSGSKDISESGISGFVINLYKGKNWKGSVFASTTSAANGQYSFTGLSDGTYSIEQINVKSNGWKQYTGDYKSVVIASGVSVTGKDFGNVASKEKKDKKDKEDKKRKKGKKEHND